MILYLNFEELSALAALAERAIVTARADGGGVVAPARIQYEIEQFARHLDGDMAIDTIAEHDRLQRIISHLLHDARIQVDQEVLAAHAAAETAVAAYFTYAHVLTVQHRLTTLGEELGAAGSPPRFRFPD